MLAPGTRGSSGLGSVSSEQMDSSTCTLAAMKSSDRADCFWVQKAAVTTGISQDTLCAAHACEHRLPHLRDGERRAPLLLQYVKADAALAVDCKTHSTDQISPTSATDQPIHCTELHLTACDKRASRGVCCRVREDVEGAEAHRLGGIASSETALWAA